MDMSSKGKGTQPGHAITDGTNHTTTVKKAESTLDQMVKSGKVSDLEKARKEVAKKTGVWANGYTN